MGILVKNAAVVGSSATSSTAAATATAKGAIQCTATEAAVHLGLPNTRQGTIEGDGSRAVGRRSWHDAAAVTVATSVLGLVGRRQGRVQSGLLHDRLAGRHGWMILGRGGLVGRVGWVFEIMSEEVITATADEAIKMGLIRREDRRRGQLEASGVH